VGIDREHHHVPHDEIRDLMEPTTFIFGSLSRLIEANNEPLLAVSMFGFVFLAVLSIIQAAQSRAAIRRRAIAINPALPRAQGGVLQSDPDNRRHNIEEVSELLFAVDRGLGSSNQGRISKIRAELIRAGYFRKDSVLFYYVARTSLACLFAYLCLTLTRSLMPSTSPTALSGFVLAGALLGMAMPAVYVHHRHRIMYQQCVLGFPSFLDLLLVCCEAGLTPRAGIDRVSREITRTHPFLGANLYLMTLELRAGRPLEDAIEALGGRINVEEVKSLGSLLQQTEELGTSLTNALRVFSDEMQTRRILRAEERAHSLPVKLVLPLALFVFPAILVVVLMPIFIRIQKTLLAGGS
jgi:tight adherence protein C